MAAANTQLTAGGAINVTATTADASNAPFTISNTTTPDSHALQSTADGAVAVTVFDSEATISVTGAADVNATGAANFTANSSLNATTTGDPGTGSTAGAGVAVAVVYGDTNAYVDGSTAGGSSVTVAANSSRTITTTADASSMGSSASGQSDPSQKNASEDVLSNNNASASDGAGSSQSVSVAGAVAVTTDTGTDQAYINNGTIAATGGGSVTVSATPTDVVSTTASGSQTSSGSGSVGVGVGVAINIVNRNNDAYISGATGITAGSISLQVLATTPSSFSASATSGDGAADVGVAGSLAINVVVDNDKADVANGATVTLSGSPSLTIEADSNITNTATAMPANDTPAQAGKVGIGASIAINYGENATQGYVDKGAAITGANNLSLTANSQQVMSTSAQNGAASGNVAVTPVIAISIADNTASATLGTGGGLDIGGDFEAQSTLNDSVQTTATGNTTASNVGVGISIALSIVNDSSQATTEQNLTAGGAAAFMSTLISGSESRATASSAGDSDKDSSGDGTGVDDQTSNQKGMAGSTASADEAKVGNSKTMGTGKNASSPKAQSSSGSVDIAGAVAVNIENGSSSASIPDGITVDAGGLVTVQSQANVDSHAISSGSATTTGSGISVGVGVSVNVSNPTNLAYVGQGAIVTGAGLAVSATMADRQVAAPAVTPSVVTIDSNTTNTPFAADSIFVGLNSGLHSGDEVLYYAETHSAIGGLTDGDSYYVNVASNGTIQLYGDGSGNGNGQADATAGNSNFIKLTSTGSGSEQEFFPYISLPMVGPEPNLLSPIKFDPTGNVTLLNLGDASEFRTGDVVTYDANGGAAIGGTSPDTPYYLIDLTGGYYQLAATQQDAFAGNFITTISGAGSAGQLVHDDTDSTFASAMSKPAAARLAWTVRSRSTSSTTTPRHWSG